MSVSLQTTAVIRQRGQLTIPDKIREMMSWIRENAVVVIETTTHDTFIVKPYSTDKYNLSQKWQKAWEAIQLTRSFKGKRGNLSGFVVEDRKAH